MFTAIGNMSAEPEFSVEMSLRHGVDAILGPTTYAESI